MGPRSGVTMRKAYVAPGDRVGSGRPDARPAAPGDPPVIPRVGGRGSGRAFLASAGGEGGGVMAEKVSPLLVASVLPADFADLGRQVQEIEKADVDRIQWDVMDGRFV